MFTQRRSARWAVQVEQHDLRRAWRAACSAVPGAHTVIDTVSGPTIVTPKITSIRHGGLIIELLPGQLATDLAAAGHRIAPYLGGIRLRVTEEGLRHALVEVLTTDPLADEVPPVPAVASALHPMILGRGEDARSVTLDLPSAAHLIVQGTTGGGKSVGLYSLLGQLVNAPDVRVTGCDPTGLLLRPWAGRWPDIPPPALGTSDPVRYVLVLDQLVKEMDHRIAGLRPGRDSVDLGTDNPVVVAVLEEYPGVLRLLDGTDTKLGKQLRALVGRLLAEGRKAGIRVVIVSQRADASILGGFERGQASHRLSFRVDSTDAVRMLHPDALPDVAAGHAAGHATAPAGVALLTAPGLPLTWLRTPHVGYAAYCRAVGGDGPQLVPVAS